VDRDDETCRKLVLGQPRQAVLGCDVWDTGDETNHCLEEESQKIETIALAMISENEMLL
jgi:hypothetical protein